MATNKYKFENMDSSPSSTLNEDEISNANTEDSLLGSRKSTETISSVTRIEEEIIPCYPIVKKKKACGPSFILITGTILILVGILTTVWTPFYILMNERLRMSPPFPPYQWWKNPPDEVLLRVYIFNVTNSQEFLYGNDTKLHLDEVGPIIFREKLEHFNVTFNQNGTLTYVAKRTAIFLPSMNSIDLDDTLIMPNLAVLGIASYLWDSSFFTKFGFNVLMKNLNSEPIIKIKIRDYLWNNSDPLLRLAGDIAPFLVPVSNMGILSRIYSNFENTVTVYIGPEHGHEKFFLIDKYDGTKNLPGYDNTCSDTLVNATEGVTYAQFLTKNSTIRYWRKTLCKVTPLFYESDVQKYGIMAYKFQLPNDTYNRTEPEDCYVSEPPLANGLSDVSKCYYNFPMAASFPHFLYGDDILKTYVDGLTPEKSKHDSFVIVEPLTGIPMESRARSQSNLVIRKLTGFSDELLKFSDTILPMFWAEYNQVGLPWYIAALVYITVNVVKPYQNYFSAFFIVLGTTLAFLSVKKLRKRRNNNYLLKNKTALFERQIFLTKK